MMIVEPSLAVDDTQRILRGSSCQELSKESGRNDKSQVGIKSLEEKKIGKAKNVSGKKRCKTKAASIAT